MTTSTTIIGGVAFVTGPHEFVAETGEAEYDRDRRQAGATLLDAVTEKDWLLGAVLEMRYGAVDGEPMTRVDIGKELGVSATTANRLLKEAEEQAYFFSCQDPLANEFREAARRRNLAA